MAGMTSHCHVRNAEIQARTCCGSNHRVHVLDSYWRGIIKERPNRLFQLLGLYWRSPPPTSSPAARRIALFRSSICTCARRNPATCGPNHADCKTSSVEYERCSSPLQMMGVPHPEKERGCFEERKSLHRGARPTLPRPSPAAHALLASAHNLFC